MRLIATCCIALLTALCALPASAQTFMFDTPISGDVVPVEVTLATTSEGVDVTVAIEPGTGDLLGLFANIDDETLLPSIAVVDPTGIVTGSQIGANAVWKVGGGNVMSPVKGWDIGVRFGANGSAGGAVTEASFSLIASDLPEGTLTAEKLTSAQNAGFILGVRIQSTLGAEGSSKMGLMEPMGEVTVSIVSPADGALLNTAIVDVSGLTSGASGVSVIAQNTVAGSISGGTFVSPGVVLAEGPNTITAVATSAMGSVMDSVDVVVDTIPPVITVIAPSDGESTNDPSILVFGTVFDVGGVEAVFVNGVQADLILGEIFEAGISLVPGPNTIFIEAVDFAGNVGTAQLVVVFDDAPQT